MNDYVECMNCNGNIERVSGEWVHIEKGDCDHLQPPQWIKDIYDELEELGGKELDEKKP